MVKFRDLLDTGSSIVAIDPKFIKANAVLKVKQDLQSPVVDVARRIVDDSDEVLIILLTPSHKNHTDTESWDIIPLDGSCNAIIHF